MWSNWWTSARWLLRHTRWNRTVSANSLVNHVDSSMAEHKWHPFRKYSGYIEYQKGQTQARKAITRPERPKPGQNGQKETKGAIFSHVSLFFFSHTHAWVSRVVGHAIALNIGIIIIFFKCNHKLQCLIKAFRWWISNWYFKFQICYLLYQFTIIVINDQVAKTNQ